LPLLLLLISFALTLVFYEISRLIFLLWNWHLFQQQSWTDLVLTFLYGIRFDLSAIAILSAIPFFFALGLALIHRRDLKFQMLGSRLVLGVFLLIQGPFLVMNMVDAEFVNFLGRRTTFDALFLAREVPGKIWSLIGYYWLLAAMTTLLLLTLVVVVFWGANKIARNSWAQNALLSWKKAGLFAVCFFVLLFVSARGGLQKKPINFAHAQIFVTPAVNNLVLNSSFTFLQTIKRESLPRDRFFSSPAELEAHLNPSGEPRSQMQGYHPGVRPNIVLIILESFSYEYTGPGGYTPFLDSLAKKSLAFNNAFANARRSIEGIGAIMGGIPSLMNEPFISSQYLTNYFLGVGTLLGKAGYETNFFHGAQNGSMYFDQFMKSAGVKGYFGKNEYMNEHPGHSQDDDGTWGIWDEPFFQWTLQKMQSFPQPFFTAIFSLSSHHPFRVPEVYQGKFPKGNLDIHESVGYTDYALKEFFSEAKKQPWFKNTIFILTADHTYKSSRPGYDNEIGHYRVPLMIYSPEIVLPKVDPDQIVQHADILPTILDLAQIPQTERNELGRSIFVPQDRFAVTYIDGRYLYITRDYFLQYHRGGDFQMFSMKDPDQKKPLSEPVAEKLKLTQGLQAVIQYFSQGMWDNRLYYPTGRQ